jgi:hypothetical protein
MAEFEWVATTDLAFAEADIAADKAIRGSLDSWQILRLPASASELRRTQGVLFQLLCDSLERPGIAGVLADYIDDLDMEQLAEALRRNPSNINLFSILDLCGPEYRSYKRQFAAGLYALTRGLASGRRSRRGYQTATDSEFVGIPTNLEMPGYPTNDQGLYLVPRPGNILRYQETESHCLRLVCEGVDGAEVSEDATKGVNLMWDVVKKDLMIDKKIPWFGYGIGRGSGN